MPLYFLDPSTANSVVGRVIDKLLDLQLTNKAAMLKSK